MLPSFLFLATPPNEKGGSRQFVWTPHLHPEATCLAKDMLMRGLIQAQFASRFPPLSAVSFASGLRLKQPDRLASSLQGNEGPAPDSLELQRCQLNVKLTCPNVKQPDLQDVHLCVLVFGISAPSMLQSCAWFGGPPKKGYPR